jgi:hypothetical protein
MTENQAPIVWTLTDYDAKQISFAQWGRLKVVICFVSEITIKESDAGRAVEFVAVNGRPEFRLKVQLDNLQNDITFHLHRTAQTFLKRGNQMIIQHNGDMMWQIRPERVKGTVISDQ